MRYRGAWAGIWLGLLAVACKSGVDDAASDGAAPDGATAAEARGPDANVNGGVTIHLVDEPAAPAGALAGLHLHVMDDRGSTVNDPQDVDLAWPTRVGAWNGTATQLLVTHGCGGPDGICGMMLPTDGLGCDDGTSYPGGCLALNLSLIFLDTDQFFAISGTFVHPTGERCHLQNGTFDVTLPVTTGHVIDPAFMLADVATGSFSVPCSNDEFRVEGTFELGVSRSVLIP